MVQISWIEILGRALLVFPSIQVAIQLLSSDDKMIQFESQYDLFQKQNQIAALLLNHLTLNTIRRIIGYVQLCSFVLIQRRKILTWVAMLNAACQMFLVFMEQVISIFVKKQNSFEQQSFPDNDRKRDEIGAKLQLQASQIGGMQLIAMHNWKK